MIQETPSRLVTDDLLEDLCSRLSAGLQIRYEIADGSLYMDRPLPFLCIYRTPTHRSDPGTKDLIHSEASYLIAPPTLSRKDISRLVQGIVKCLQERFNAFLLVEVWAAADSEVQKAAAESDLEPTELRPTFTIAASSFQVPLRTVESLRKQLEKITYLKQNAVVRIDTSSSAYPKQMAPLFSDGQIRQLGGESIGIAVLPTYRNPQTGEVYPAVLRSLKLGMGRALKQAFYTFSKTHTNTSPEHFYSMSSRTIVRSVKQVDKRISEVSNSFSFLLQVTPVNAEAAWHEFKSSRFQQEPRYYYRPLAVEPSLLKRRLFDMPIDKIDDPTLAELFRQRQDELDRKITMLTDVGTRRFVLGSQQIYGDIDQSLVTLAEGLLERISPRSREDKTRGEITASAFAKRARKEISYYLEKQPRFAAEVIVRDDMYSGLMCSDGNLLIGRHTRIPVTRVEALLQHEVGTHLLTYYNGLVEQFQLLHTGLAGYDSLQEGIAVLSEYLVGGLSKPRLRILAARVVAVQMMLDGASFTETFHKLDHTYGFTQRTAYTITMRIYRGGGFTKDAVYLRGLVEILDHLGQGGALEPLFVGKIAREHIRFIRELQLRGVIRPAAVLPRYLQLPGVSEKLQALSHGMSVFDLIEG